MDLWRDSELVLREVNADWERSGYPVRIRYFQIIADPGEMDGWVLLPVIEMRGDGEVEDQSSFEDRRAYEQMVRNRFLAEDAIDQMLILCRFRTSRELEEPAHQMGVRVAAGK